MDVPTHVNAPPARGGAADAVCGYVLKVRGAVDARSALNVRVLSAGDDPGCAVFFFFGGIDWERVS